MTDKVFTQKQEDLMRMLKRKELKRINILEGSVRSGKTWISLVLWAFWVATMPENGVYLMVAKTLTSLRRNCLDLLQSLVGKSSFSYSLSKKEGRLFGRLVYLEGVNDARAESKIRGMTLTGAYCDEVTLFTEEFFTMLLSRLSDDGAKLIGTTNPDNPHHWLMAKYLTRQDELSLMSMKFTIEDNTFLGQEYVEALKKEYTGVYYDRFILGLWKAAEGVIYDMFDEQTHVVELPEKPDFSQYYVSVDYGTQNPSVFLLWGKRGAKWYLAEEYYYDGRARQKQKTDSEYADDLIKFIDGRPYIRVIVDPSAASFIAELKKRGVRVKKGNNDVLDGIRFVGSLLTRRELLISRKAEKTISEFYSYAWDQAASLRGEDKPVKEHDHCMDAVRYFCYTVLRPGGVAILK